MEKAVKAPDLTESLYGHPANIQGNPKGPFMAVRPTAKEGDWKCLERIGCARPCVESREKFEKDNVEIEGVVIHESYQESKDLKTTVVKIETEEGARTMEKPCGTYITMEAPNLVVPDEDYHREISVELADHLRKLLRLDREKSILVVGLGNREITPGRPGTAGHTEPENHPPYCEGIRFFRYGRGKSAHGQQSGARSDGPDGNGNF